MTIQFVTGDIFKANVEALVNPVNCVGVMGRGLAKIFKREYPTNFDLYQKACDWGEVVPGKMFVTYREGVMLPRFIINFPTKRDWREPSRIEDIRAGMRALRILIREQHIKSIALPALGCGLGGLAWEEVQPIMLAFLSYLPHVEILVFEPDSERVSKHDQRHSSKDLGP